LNNPLVRHNFSRKIKWIKDKFAFLDVFTDFAEEKSVEHFRIILNSISPDVKKKSCLSVET